MNLKALKNKKKKFILLKGIKAIYRALKSGIFSLPSGNHSEQ